MVGIAGLRIATGFAAMSPKKGGYMDQRKPILIWRLREIPSGVEETLLEDGFIGDKQKYREWRGSKAGDEFVVLIPGSYSFDDMDVASELGLKVGMIDAEESNPDCDAFLHLHFGRSESGLLQGYNGYVIPSLTGRTAIPTLGEHG